MNGVKAKEARGAKLVGSGARSRRTYRPLPSVPTARRHPAPKGGAGGPDHHHSIRQTKEDVFPCTGMYTVIAVKNV
ncbi:hypothetical protein EYF80_059246 [Liparis tanakae]|uniref:Uncharacterized protein n=1 Tax=Liparis tanakae TaxID=230148 RepID=A0A4Z2EPX5_9TELE|nr:hypothetical protein EYF80_059246 [Liparis tanakae]